MKNIYIILLFLYICIVQLDSALISGNVTPDGWMMINEIEFVLLPIEAVDGDIFPNWQATPFTDMSYGENTFMSMEVPAGDYLLAVFAQGFQDYYYEDGDSFESATIISLNQNDILDNLEITLHQIPHYYISGYIINQDTEPIVGASVVAMPTSNQYFPYEPVLTDINGLFTMLLPEGNYLFSAYSDSLYSQFNGNVNSYSDVDLINLNEDIFGMEFTLQTIIAGEYNDIYGTVQENNNPPDYPVFVIAISSDEHEDWEASSSTRSEGEFMITNVVPSECYLYVVSNEAPPTYYDETYDWLETEPINSFTGGDNIEINLNRINSIGVMTISGFVRNQDNNPESNVTVVACDEQGLPYGFSITDDQGFYHIHHLVCDYVNLIATKPFFESDTLQIALTENSYIDFEIRHINSPVHPSGISEPSELLVDLYPNPFILSNNRSIEQISFSFDSKHSKQYKLQIYNIKGQKVHEQQEKFSSGGINTIFWDGKTKLNTEVNSGVYLYKLIIDNKLNTGKLLIMR